MDIDLVNQCLCYLPQVFGAMLVANALRFFGQNDKLEKNNLTFSSLGFMVLVFQSLLSTMLVCWQYYDTMAPQSVYFFTLCSSILMTLGCLLMIVGAFEYARIFVWLHKIITVPIFLLVWTFSVLMVKDQLFFENTESIYSLYLAIALFVLGLFFCWMRFSVKAYNLRIPGVVLLFFAAYFCQNAFNPAYQSWLIEALFYLLLVWSIYWTTLRQMRYQIRNLAEELRTTKAKIPMIIQASPFPVIVSALKDDRVMLANEKACALFNIDPKNIKDFKTEQYYVDANVHRDLLEKLTTSATVENFQAKLHKPNSDENFWLEIYARIIDYDNEVALYSAFKDITAQKQQEQDLFKKAVLDPLTGCYNRRQFQELASREITTAQRYNNPFCVIMMDIDHFKNVNDTYGHAFGDEVLKTLARICKSTLRESDIFARYGGEEFICMLTQTDLKGGQVLAEKLRKNIETKVIKQPSGKPFSFTVSVGIAGSEASQDLSSLVKCADSALYVAKESGRNQVRVYDASQTITMHPTME